MNSATITSQPSKQTEKGSKEPNRILLFVSAVNKFNKKPINNSLGISNHDVTRTVISIYNWTPIVHRNSTSIENAFQNNNGMLNASKGLIYQKEYVHYASSFCSDVQTHVNLSALIAETIMDSRRQKRKLISGIGTIFTTITGKLDASGGEFFTKGKTDCTGAFWRIQCVLLHPW